MNDHGNSRDLIGQMVVFSIRLIYYVKHNLLRYHSDVYLKWILNLHS